MSADFSRGHRPSRCLLGGVILAIVGMTAAHAEGPMANDDAGTLALGGMKVEAVWFKDDKVDGLEAVFGFGVVEGLELEVVGAYAKDGAASPATRLRGIGFGAKWVPYQNDLGWSLGARFDYGRVRVDEREAGVKFTGREYAVTGLASYRFDNGHALHANLGSARVKALGEGETVGTWDIGYELPVADGLQLTAETYGAEGSRPDKAVGLRYEVLDGLKVSAAIGRGNDRRFGQIGVAWEF